MAADGMVFADPIIALLEDDSGMELADDFISHLISLSDVVKNDMRKLLDWDESVIDSKLCDIVAARLDKNGRYRERPLEASGEPGEKFSKTYIDSQCLLTEWLAIYRALRVYLHIRKRQKAA